MTESEWLKSNDPLGMLCFLGESASLRKRQLFALACYMSAEDLLNEWGKRGLAELQKAEDEEWLGEEAAHDEAWGDVDGALNGLFWQHGLNTGAICRDEDLWDAVEQARESDLTDWHDPRAVAAGATFIVASQAVNDGYVRSLYGIHPPLGLGKLLSAWPRTLVRLVPSRSRSGKLDCGCSRTSFEIFSATPSGRSLLFSVPG
jgi:hypothetical protein